MRSGPTSQEPLPREMQNLCMLTTTYLMPAERAPSIAAKTAVVLLFWPQSPAAPKEKLDPGGGVGPGVAVIVGVGPIVGVAVGVPVPPAPAQLTTSSRRFDAASFGLKAYWSLLAGF